MRGDPEGAHQLREGGTISKYSSAATEGRIGSGKGGSRGQSWTGSSIKDKSCVFSGFLVLCVKMESDKLTKYCHLRDGLETFVLRLEHFLLFNDERFSTIQKKSAKFFYHICMDTYMIDLLIDLSFPKKKYRIVRRINFYFIKSCKSFLRNPVNPLQ